MQHAPDATRATRAHPTARLEDTQKLNVRGAAFGALRRHVRQQRLLGSVAGGRDLRELQDGTALQRWMRCSFMYTAAETHGVWARG
jgi:hypothetical protein